VKPKSKQAEVKRVNEFHCCGKAMEHADFMAHLTNIHGFVKGTPCTRSLVQALDGLGFYSNVFKLEIPCGDKTIEVTQVSSGPTKTYCGDE
jgi:hypothetical protein